MEINQQTPPVPKLPDTPFAFTLYFLKYYRLGFALMFIFEIGQAACQIMVPYAVKRLIDHGGALSGSFDQALMALKPDLYFFAALSFGVLFFSRASGTTLVMVAPSLRRRVRATLFHYLQYHSHRYFIGNFAGSLANRISEVSMGVNHSLWTIMFDFLPVSITFGVSFYLMYNTHATLATFLGSWIIIYITVSFLLARRCQVYSKKFAAARSTVSGKIVDGVTNILNTKLFARLSFERKYLTGYLDMEVSTARKTLWFMEGMRWFQNIATVTLQISMMALALKFWVEGKLGVGAFAMVTSLSLMIIVDARGLSRRFLDFFEYLGNISDGVGIIVKPHEVLDEPNATNLQISKGQIEFKNVSFKYKEGTDVFQNLNVVIRSGERVGLVGFSGSGKTTFVNLMLRTFDLQGGGIEMDGQNIARHKQDSLRAQISMIPQDPMLFHRTLMENIRYGRSEATDEEVINAAKLAHAHEFIEKIPEGYNALVGERGIKLSGGQRQRIAIARAILKDAPVLIMDEATSSLDSVTEDLIQKSLNHLMKDRTVIVVAHRLSTIARLNRILVFHEGKIIEDGTHESLLRLNGHYAMLWGCQVGGFLPEKDPAAPPAAELI